jgi:maltooligosyltrehalose trehalohydrolase
VDLVLEGKKRGRVVPLARTAEGIFEAEVAEAKPGDRYRYQVDGSGPFPDPASRFQPEGVHGPSLVVDPGRFGWTDQGWRGIEPEKLVFYELHLGTFSPEGTFAGASARLGYLAELGVTAIELMPIADFAGERNWGYDGAALFAPARCYGTPDDLRRFVDEAHNLGLAVFLDVVYNHFGPAGNYAFQFSSRFLTDAHKSDWGAAVNLDGEDSGLVRRFFVENALHWVHEYHFDGLRLDATHALRDESARHFLAELAERVRGSVADRRVLVVAEDNRNLARLLLPEEAGGWDLDGVWADDFHHEIRRLVAGDDEGYFRDYRGTALDLATTIARGWFYTGQHSVHQGSPRGTDPAGIPLRRFVICLQNHDQIGNRALGDRLTAMVDLAVYRAATALLLCAPETPLLFMGQEFAATTPFLYFTDHEAELGRLISEGRRREFGHFRAFSDPSTLGRIPDPQAVETFLACRLDWAEASREPHALVLRLYRALLHLRRSEPVLHADRRELLRVKALDEATLALRRGDGTGRYALLVVRLLGSGTIDLGAHPELELPHGMAWDVALTTEDAPFAADPAPPVVERVDGVPVITFSRPSAVLLRAEGGELALG